IISLIFFIILFINLKKYLYAILAAFIFIQPIIKMIRMYRFAIATTPYLVIEKDGIIFKKKYCWDEIESIKIDRYFTAIWTEDMLISLKRGERIRINLAANLLDEDLDVIAAFIKKYKT